MSALQVALAEDPGRSQNAGHILDVRRIYSPTETPPPEGVTMAEALALAQRLEHGDRVALSLAGTCHNIMGLLQHDEPFDLLAPDMAPEATMVPYKLMYDQMLEHIGTRRTTPRFQQLSPATIYHIATPPPKEDEAYIRAKMMRYRGIALGSAILNPAPVRLRLWEIEMEALKEVCAEWGVHFLAVPDAARTRSGFLKPEYYAPDATHANAAYGALVLEQLDGLAAGGSARTGEAR
ncbi:SGNH/GDSL hydrolase family protein [Neorhizobium sp. AL 9.2.2]|uniref:SGNH/GDSL hydrolase family protein n=1 Tax=Neorhizobium sp. AL 9.2.2 TaxID=2712894 RepID=UPI001571A253|nr:SGNH/GDSL hydrolase family protein [Neorhizobium sp. AL 9.2.2]NSY19765.1 hypothetical protein [Neorhizobium sp. AL 9.2.2]